MPKEAVYGDEQVALDRDGNEWPVREIPPGTDVRYVQRGVSIHWGKDAESVEIGVSLIETSTGEHLLSDLPEGHLTGAFTRLDQQSLTRLIRTLQRAGRQSFGANPW